MPEFRLYTTGGASLDLEMLVNILEARSANARTAQEAQRRVIEGVRFGDSEALQKAVAEISVQIGAQIAYANAAALLKSVKDELVRKDAA